MPRFKKSLGLAAIASVGIAGSVLAMRVPEGRRAGPPLSADRPNPVQAAILDMAPRPPDEQDRRDQEAAAAVLKIKALTERLDQLAACTAAKTGGCARDPEVNSILIQIQKEVSSWKGRIKAADLAGVERDCLANRNAWAGISKDFLDEERDNYLESLRRREFPDAKSRFLALNEEMRTCSINVLTTAMTNPSGQAMSCVELEKLEQLIEMQRKPAAGSAAG